MTTIASKEVRQRAITAYDAGNGSQEHIASLFQITTRTFQKWLKAYRQEGRLAPQPRGHNPTSFAGKNLAALDHYMEKHPDATLAELQGAFADRVTCSDVTIHNTLKRLGWTYKKSGYVRTNEIDRT